MGRLQICVASIAVLLISQAEAVEVGKPSKTSISSAARRALAAHDYDPTFVTRTGWRRHSSVRENEKSSLTTWSLKISSAITARRLRNKA